MAVIKRADVAPPVLPKQTVEVDALSGEVVVRGLLLTEFLGVQARLAAYAKEAQTKQRQEDAGAGSVHAILPVLLALCVEDADGLPVFTQAQWQVFGAKHTSQAIALFNVAWELSGFNQAAAAKN